MIFNQASISKVTEVTPSDTDQSTGGREFWVLCTTAGDVKVALSSAGDEITFPVTVGLTRFNWEVRQVFVTGTTAVATYYNAE